MSFALTAKAEYAKQQPKPREDDTRGIATAARYEVATGQTVVFDSYTPDGAVILDIDDSKFIVRKERQFEAGTDRMSFLATTIHADLVRTCTNTTTPHTHYYPVTHEGAFNGTRRTTEEERSVFFMLNVGQVVSDNPKCPTCGELFGD